MFPINDNPNSSVSGGGNFCQAASSSRTRQEEEARRQAVGHDRPVGRCRVGQVGSGKP